MFYQFLHYVKMSSTTQGQKVVSLISFVHSIALRLAIIKNFSHAIILEDDAQLDRNFIPMFSALWSSRPADGVLFQLNPVVPVNEKCSSREKDLQWTKGIELSSGAYVVSNAGAQFLYTHLVRSMLTSAPVDISFKQLMHEAGGGYHVRISPDIDYNTNSDALKFQRWRYVMRECGLVVQRPIPSLRESMSDTSRRRNTK
jgi:GR25 family glycosyltransferase involved in LPS biosynthesis